MNVIVLSHTTAATLHRRYASIVKRALLLALTFVLAGTAFAVAPYAPADQPFVDAEGRTRVVIDFLPGSERSYLDAAQPRPRTRENDDGRKIEFFHRPQAAALVADYERRYGFEKQGMTSWTGVSVTAYLTPEQIERLQQDEAVRKVSDDTRALTMVALKGLRHIYRPGYSDKKCGVMLMELTAKQQRQETLFDDAAARAKSAKLMVAMDVVNSVWGRGTLRTGAAGMSKGWAMRSENRSPRYTTSWDELPMAN